MITSEIKARGEKAGIRNDQMIEFIKCVHMKSQYLEWEAAVKSCVREMKGNDPNQPTRVASATESPKMSGTPA